ncbi:hypothetical protein T02_9250 [Trichinella nativa]|uniref:Uncharacterized protein n=1 Tax=Trichinella nativa TaxID=6335 RepID=A0A0V1LTP2_9BILA|nr:hypothetical protein T02_9250 [Trichinella nativa]
MAFNNYSQHPLHRDGSCWTSSKIILALAVNDLPLNNFAKIYFYNLIRRSLFEISYRGISKLNVCNSSH